MKLLFSTGSMSQDHRHMPPCPYEDNPYYENNFQTAIMLVLLAVLYFLGEKFKISLR